MISMPVACESGNVIGNLDAGSAPQMGSTGGNPEVITVTRFATGVPLCLLYGYSSMNRKPRRGRRFDGDIGGLSWLT